jgi:glycine cleavage system H lipoate-binding protein
MKKIIIFITVVFLISSCSLTPKNEGKVVDVNQKLNDQTNTVDSGAVKSSNIFTGEEKSNFEVNILADKQVYTNKDFHFQAEYPL